MAVPFAQTTRARHADQGRISRSVLGFAVVLLLLWGLWFFTASTYQYVTSKKIEIIRKQQPSWKIPEGDKRAEAYVRYMLRISFPHSDLKRIKTGQQVRLTVRSTDTLPWHPFLTRVDRVDRKSGMVHARLEIPADVAARLAGVALEKVEIAVFRQTPASFLFHNNRSDSGGESNRE